eukprot:TRINITY_DN5840_c0_g3_i1.p1 TRINITY_DN5840_c0_g3~~TRINITY_DN5840_c0_g3_i1.p1  ORF type:complete len:518 (+),score=95.50 TRINITY_DN5840_c0_g3_i1:59-1555(+)
MKSVSKGENLCPCSRKNLVKSYCQKCNIYICYDCLVKHHYVHSDKVVDLTEKCCRYLADYQKLDRSIALMADCKEIHIRKEPVDAIINELKRKLAGSTKSLNKDMSNSLQLMDKSSLGREMIVRRAELAKKDAGALGQMRDEVKKMCKTLRKCLAESKYEATDKLLTENSLQDCEERIKRLSSDIDSDVEFIAELQKFRQDKISYSYDPMAVLGMIKINTLIKKPNRIVQFDSQRKAMVIYNIDTQETLATPLASDFALPFRFAAIEVNGNIYLSGGDDRSQYFRSLYFYDEVRGGLIPMEEMQVARSRHALVEVNNQMYAVGGENESGIIRNCEVYDMKANSWRAAPSLIEPRCAHAACYGSGKIYAIGGCGECYLDSIEVLNIGQKAWTQIKVREVNIQFAGAILKEPGEIMIFGGYKENEILSKATFTFDPKTRKIEKGKALKEADAFIASEIKAVDKKVYAFGYTKGGVHVFDEARNEWDYLAYRKLLSSLKIY